MENTIAIWFRLALGDLAAARALYQAGHYRQSYFLFQQASEKANKGFILMAKEATPQELKQSSHAQLGMYKEVAKKKRKDLSAVIEILKPFPHAQQTDLAFLDFNAHETMVNKALEGFTQLEQKTDTITENDLTELIYDIKDLEKIPVRRPRNLTAVVKDHFIKQAAWLHGFGTEEALASERELLEVIHHRKKLKQIVYMTYAVGIFQSKLMFTQATFFTCAMITNKHSTSTRYADGGIDPDTIYNKKLPVVRKQLQFMSLLKKGIERLILLDQEKNI